MNNEDTKSQSTQSYQPSDAIKQLVEDGQSLIAHIAKEGDVELDAVIVQNIIEAKHKLNSEQWSVDEEVRFLLNYDKLADVVSPVTVESINAIIPKKIHKWYENTKAQSAVLRYRLMTMFSLVLLLMAQLYAMIGSDLTGNVQRTFDLQFQTTELISVYMNQREKLEELVARQVEQSREFEANLRMLKYWNFFWLLGDSFTKMKIAPNNAYQSQSMGLPDAQETGLEDLELGAALNAQAHDTGYYKHTISAQYVLTVFQGYILPLLYGFLGASIYVLRNLMREIKLLTYTYDSEIRYRLRVEQWDRCRQWRWLFWWATTPNCCFQ